MSVRRTGMVGSLVLLGFAGAGAGCGPPETPSGETLTRGSIAVVCEPPVAPILRSAIREFETLYPEAEVRLRTGTAREALSALFGAEAQAAVVGREFAEEEREAARAAGISLTAHRWARDAVGVVVHPDNPVEQLSLDELREIFTGTLVSWSELGGPAQPVLPVTPGPETGIFQFFADRVMSGEPFAAPALVRGSDSAVVAEVRKNRNGIGLVSLPFADRGVRALRLSPFKGLPYVALDARSVYEDRYPLTRFYNVMLREPGSPLARGFNTFLAGADGQRWVRDADLVPATVPVRFTIRTPTVPAHE